MARVSFSQPCPPKLLSSSTPCCEDAKIANEALESPWGRRFPSPAEQAESHERWIENKSLDVGFGPLTRLRVCGEASSASAEARSCVSNKARSRASDENR